MVNNICEKCHILQSLRVDKLRERFASFFKECFDTFDQLEQLLLRTLLTDSNHTKQYHDTSSGHSLLLISSVKGHFCSNKKSLHKFTISVSGMFRSHTRYARKSHAARENKNFFRLFLFFHIIESRIHFILILIQELNFKKQCITSVCILYTGHRGCSTEQFEVGNLGSMKLA